MLSGQQIHAIELLAVGGITNKTVANTVGVSETTIYNWKNDNEFCEAVIVKSQEIYRNSIPDVSRTLIANAKKGDIAAIRIYFDHLELIEKMRLNRADMNISFSWAIPPVETVPDPSGVPCTEQ